MGHSGPEVLNSLERIPNVPSLCSYRSTGLPALPPENGELAGSVNRDAICTLSPGLGRLEVTNSTHHLRGSLGNTGSDIQLVVNNELLWYDCSSVTGITSFPPSR